MKPAPPLLIAAVSLPLVALPADAQNRDAPASSPGVSLSIPIAHGGSTVTEVIRQVADGGLGVDIEQRASAGPAGPTFQLVPGRLRYPTVTLESPFADASGAAFSGNFRVESWTKPGIAHAVRTAAFEPLGVEVIATQVAGPTGRPQVQLAPGRLRPIILHFGVGPGASNELLAWRVAVRDGIVDGMRVDFTFTLVNTDMQNSSVFFYKGCLPQSIGVPVGSPIGGTPVQLQCESFAARGLRPWLQSWVTATFTQQSPDRRDFTLTETRSDGTRVQLAGKNGLLVSYTPPAMNRAPGALESVGIAFDGP